jgi:hypothetical protein
MRTSAVISSGVSDPNDGVDFKSIQTTYRLFKIHFCHYRVSHSVRRRKQLVQIEEMVDLQEMSSMGVQMVPSSSHQLHLRVRTQGINNPCGVSTSSVRILYSLSTSHWKP